MEGSSAGDGAGGAAGWPDGIVDPFAGDPTDPTAELTEAMQALDDDGDGPPEPLEEAERAEVLDDIADLEVFSALLEPRGVRGIVVDCGDCDEPHYFDWTLLAANLRHLLAVGEPRMHEPAADPDPDLYVTWDYARGYADGVADEASDT